MKCSLVIFAIVLFAVINICAASPDSEEGGEVKGRGGGGEHKPLNQFAVSAAGIVSRATESTFYSIVTLVTGDALGHAVENYKTSRNATAATVAAATHVIINSADQLAQLRDLIKAVYGGAKECYSTQNLAPFVEKIKVGACALKDDILKDTNGKWSHRVISATNLYYTCAGGKVAVILATTLSNAATVGLTKYYETGDLNEAYSVTRKYTRVIMKKAMACITATCGLATDIYTDIHAGKGLKNTVTKRGKAVVRNISGFDDLLFLSLLDTSEEHESGDDQDGGGDVQEINGGGDDQEKDGGGDDKKKDGGGDDQEKDGEGDDQKKDGGGNDQEKDDGGD